MGVSRADNCVKIWRNLPISNPKPDLHNINAHLNWCSNYHHVDGPKQWGTDRLFSIWMHDFKMHSNFIEVERYLLKPSLWVSFFCMLFVSKGNLLDFLILFYYSWSKVSCGGRKMTPSTSPYCSLQVLFPFGSLSPSWLVWRSNTKLYMKTPSFLLQCDLGFQQKPF